MNQITDKSISKVYEGKVLEGKGQFFNFYLEGGKKKYGLFVGKGKTVPKEGMRVAMMEWETKQEGEYENNKVTKIVWIGASEQVTGKSTTSNSGDKNSPIWFCLSYAKDIQAVRIRTGYTDPNMSLEELGLEAASVAIDMLRFIQNPVDLAKDKIPDQTKDAIQNALEADVSDNNILY